MTWTSSPIYLTSKWRRVTSRALWRHVRDVTAISWQPTLRWYTKWRLALGHMDGCHMCCQGLSPKRHGRFRSFLASKLPWPRLLDMWKFVILDPISWPWENFLVSMATKSFPWKQTSPDFFRSRPGPPCQVWPPSVHKRRRSFRTNAATDTTQIIVRYI